MSRITKTVLKLRKGDKVTPRSHSSQAATAVFIDPLYAAIMMHPPRSCDWRYCLLITNSSRILIHAIRPTSPPHACTTPHAARRMPHQGYHKSCGWAEWYTAYDHNDDMILVSVDNFLTPKKARAMRAAALEATWEKAEIHDSKLEGMQGDPRKGKLPARVLSRFSPSPTPPSLSLAHSLSDGCLRV